MFLKIEKRKNKDGSVREYLYVAKTIRQGNKIIHKNIASLGRFDVLAEGDTFENLAKKFAEFAGKLEVLNLEKDLNLEAAKELGIVHIYAELWKGLGFDRVLNKYYQAKDVKFDIQESIFAMVANRLTAPSSKREIMNWKEEIYKPEWEEIKLHHLYRAMDYLVEEKEQFETELFNRSINLFNQKLDIIMFDTTTISSWGNGEHSELLKHHGKPKDKRTDLKQICVGVLMTKEGIPVGHEVWEGPRSERKSFVDMIDRVRDKFQIGKVIFVCDKGMISANIIRYLEEQNYEYILGVRMKQLSKEDQRQYLGEAGFKAVIRTDKKRLDVKEVEEEETITIEGEKVEINKRYIICHNLDEAQKDKLQRERFKEIIRAKVADSGIRSWIIKNGYKNYVKFEGENIKLVVDEKKLDEEDIFDGKWILVTNTNLSSEEAVRNYKGLSKIEAGFRDLKSEIEIGPMYHWTTKRIRAHVFICFLALVLKLGFEKKLKELDSKIDIAEVIRSVSKIKVAELELNDKIVHLRTGLKDKAYLAFRAISAKIPEKILLTKQKIPPLNPALHNPKNVVPTPVNLRLF